MPARPTAPRLRHTLVLLFLAGCHGDDPCAGLGDEIERENCQLERVSTLFQAGDARWKEQLSAIPSATSRDLVRLRLAILEPQQGPVFCAEVETADARARCQQVVGRPHLSSPPRPPSQEKR